jgi:hypothetical protein
LGSDGSEPQFDVRCEAGLFVAPAWLYHAASRRLGGIVRRDRKAVSMIAGGKRMPTRAVPTSSSDSGTEAEVPRWWSVAVALAVFAVYLAQCPTVSGDKDSAEFTLVLALNGVAHPTGYPLHTLFGHAFVRLIHGLGATWAYAANAWSATGGGVAMYFLQRLSLSLMPTSTRLGRRGRFLLGLLPLALLAYNPVWTYETTLAEVYSWHVAWGLGTTLYFVRLVRALANEEDWPTLRLHRSAAAWGLLCGIGGAHHATSVFVAAPLSLALLVVLVARRRLATALIATVLVATCVPLLSYGIILWRTTHPATCQWPTLAPGFGGLIHHVSGSAYLDLLGRFAPGPEQRRFLLWYVYPFLFPVLLLAPVNALRSRRLDERTLSWGLASAALMGTAYAFDYGAPDPSSYFLLPMSLGLVGITPLLASFMAGGPTARRAALACAALLGITSIVLSVPWLRTGRQRVGVFVSFDRFVHDMWSSIPADSGFVFWTNDMNYKLRVYQLLAGEKPGLWVGQALMLNRTQVREQFLRQNGFDPMVGFVLDEQAMLSADAKDTYTREAIDSIESRVNAMTGLPVIHFDPQVPTVRLLLKPPADAGAKSITRRR